MGTRYPRGWGTGPAWSWGAREQSWARLGHGACGAALGSGATGVLELVVRAGGDWGWLTKIK